MKKARAFCPRFGKVVENRVFPAKTPYKWGVSSFGGSVLLPFGGLAPEFAGGRESTGLSFAGLSSMGLSSLGLSAGWYAVLSAPLFSAFAGCIATTWYCSAFLSSTTL